MHLVTITFLAFGLAMDAFAVSISSGIAIRNPRIEQALKVAIFFGAFQAIMPVIGWLAGLGLRELIAQVDHWIAFGLLFLIGCRMIYESTKAGSKRRVLNPLSLGVLVLLSVATSIDALAAGVSLAFLKISIVLPIIVIGVVTFILSFLGVFVGDKSGHLFESKAEFVGGLVLIGIGTKILIEHLA
ncbi:MAG: manganese efflux pump MntP family protein [Candidatus Zixiibacteriota bacterium]